MMKVRELGKFIRDQRRTASLSLRKLSSLAGVSNPYLSQIERGLRRPSAEILKEIAKALSISAETLYIKAGILDERVEDVDTVGAVRRDPTISEKQKQLLVDLYQSFKAPSPPTQRPRNAPVAKASGKASPGRAVAAKNAAKKKAPSRTRARATAPKSAKKSTRPGSGNAPSRKGVPSRSATSRTATSRKSATGRRRAGT